MECLKNKTLARVAEHGRSPSLRDLTLKERLKILEKRTKEDLGGGLGGNAVWLGRCLWDNKGVYIVDSLFNSDGTFELVKKDIEKTSRFVPDKIFEEKLQILDATFNTIQVNDDTIYTDLLGEECAKFYLERVGQDIPGRSKGIIMWPRCYSIEIGKQFLNHTRGISLNYSKGDNSRAHCISLIRNCDAYTATTYLKPKEVKEAPKLEEKVAA